VVGYRLKTPVPVAPVFLFSYADGRGRRRRRRKWFAGVGLASDPERGNSCGGVRIDPLEGRGSAR